MSLRSCAIGLARFAPTVTNLGYGLMIYACVEKQSRSCRAPSALLDVWSMAVCVYSPDTLPLNPETVEMGICAEY